MINLQSMLIRTLLNLVRQELCRELVPSTKVNDTRMIKKINF